ncbi:PhzF family phenazine biosynthesis protein [Rhodococcus sp. 1.20]
MATSRDILRLTAFSSDPAGGNPAGVVLDARGLDDSELQSVAAEVGYAETAFLIEPVLGGNPRHSRIRYFSPIAEVPFCGHATIATAIALTERDGEGTFTFETPIGPVSIDTATDEDGRSTATFTSVEPSVSPIDHAVLTALLGLIGVDSSALDARYPAMLSYAGNTHPIVVLRDQSTFDEFTFDPSAMRILMDAQGWAGTVTILHPLDDNTFEARNLFPVETSSRIRNRVRSGIDRRLPAQTRTRGHSAADHHPPGPTRRASQCARSRHPSRRRYLGHRHRSARRRRAIVNLSDEFLPAGGSIHQSDVTRPSHRAGRTPCLQSRQPHTTSTSPSHVPYSAPR